LLRLRLERPRYSLLEFELAYFPYHTLFPLGIANIVIVAYHHSRRKPTTVRGLAKFPNHFLLLFLSSNS